MSNAPKFNRALVAQEEKGNQSQKEWIIDSGTSHHITDDCLLFQSHKLSYGKDKIFYCKWIICICGREMKYVTVKHISC